MISAPVRVMDVLFVTRGYYPHSRGGAENQAQLQAEALVRHGHRVTVVCPAAPGELNEAAYNGVRVVRLGAPPLPGGLGRIAYAARLAVWVLTQARRFDLVHIHGLRLESNFLLPLARLMRRPVYLKLASSGPTGEWARWRNGTRRWLLMARFATRIQTLTQELADQIAADGVPREHIVRIDNGIDLSRFRPTDAKGRREARIALGLPADGVIVLYCGTFQALKGTAELLSAWQRLGPKRATLVLAGEETQGYRLPAPDGVIVRPWQEDVAPYYRAADVFVLPSRAEGMSNALLEALASGLAVVATRVGAAGALLGDCERGLLVEVGDTAALASALGRLMDDGELRERLAEQAPGAVAGLGADAIAAQIEAAYHGMLGR